MAISSSKHCFISKKIVVVVVVFLAWGYNSVLGQSQLLTLVKKGRLVKTYATGDYISFLDRSQEWQYGILNKIWKDSFSIKPYLLRAGTLDTIGFSNYYYSLTDIFAMPKQGIQIEDVQGSNSHQINRAAGHVHFFWVKGGWLFRAFGLGYSGLHIFNSLLVSHQPISLPAVGYPAAVFLFGEFLKYNYKPYVRVSKKYYFKIL